MLSSPGNALPELTETIPDFVLGTPELIVLEDISIFAELLLPSHAEVIIATVGLSQVMLGSVDEKVL